MLLIRTITPLGGKGGNAEEWVKFIPFPLAVPASRTAEFETK